MPMNNAFILTIACFAATTFAALFLTFYIRRQKEACENTIEARIIRAIILASAAVILCTGTMIVAVQAKAEKHGAYGDPMTFADTLRAINHSPVEDELPEDLRGKIILYFRFGCPDCEAVFEELSRRAEPYGDDVYWISTRSEQGIELRKTYPCDHVPSAVYISTKSLSDAWYTRLDKTIGETVQLDTEAWETLEHQYAHDHKNK